MEVYEAILKRRSVRKFTDQPLSEQHIDTLLKAAMAAPSAMNRRPWEFIVVDDPGLLRRVKQGMVFGRYNAPCAVVVCGNLRRASIGPSRDFWIQDTSAAMENLLLAATGLGLGAVWLGITPVKTLARTIGRILNLPGHVVPLGVALVGWPADSPAPRTQYDPARVHRNGYRNRPPGQEEETPAPEVEEAGAGGEE